MRVHVECHLHYDTIWFHIFYVYKQILDDFLVLLLASLVTTLHSLSNNWVEHTQIENELRQ